MRNRFRHYFMISLLLGLHCPAVNAQLPEKGETSAVKVNPKAAAGKAKTIDAGREAALLTFVRENHAELAELLEQLKPKESEKYQAALVDLDRDVKRLEQLRKRGADVYEPELQLWRSRSRVRLLAARLSMTDDAALGEELKEALRDLRQRELASVEREIAGVKTALEKQRQKLDRLERQQSKLKSNEDKWVEQQLNALKQSQSNHSRVAGIKPTAPMLFRALALLPV